MYSQKLLLITILMSGTLEAQEYHFAHHPLTPEPEEVRGNTLHLSKEHMLYLGSSAGLWTFDGNQFQQVPLPVHPDSNQGVTALGTSGEDLLVGMADGHVFRLSHQTLIPVGMAGVPVKAFAMVPDKQILAATYGNGLMIMTDPSARSGYRSEVLPSKDLYAMQSDGLGRLWIGSDAGISLIDPGHQNSDLLLGKDHGLRDEISISLTRSTDGLMWAGSFERGFCSIDTALHVAYPVEHWSFGPIVAMIAIDHREVWISTEEHGIFLYRRGDGMLKPVTIPGNANPVIVSMVTDSEGNLWLLDMYKGLYSTNRRFEEYPVNIEGIQAMIFSREGRLYAGNAHGLYALYPDRPDTPEQMLKAVNIISLYEDGFGNLWAGTFGEGLYCRLRGTDRWYLFKKENGLTDESILSITGVRDTLWLATLGGVTRIVIDKPVDPYRLNSMNYNLADGLGTNFIYTTFADSKGRVWFGTDGKGLSVLDHDHIRNFQSIDTVPLHSVYSIAEDTEGAIWFVTDRDGVFKFDGARFTSIALPPLLQGHEISSIISDQAGNMLLAHTSGVDLITPQGNTMMFRGAPTELLNPNLNAFFRDSSGGIWIAGQNTLLKYHPLAFASRSTPYNLLTHVRVFLTPVDFHQKQIFSATENYLTFDFIGLWYSDPLEVTYRYRLQGLDPEWQETRERSVTYQNLPPGQYRFLLESSSSGLFQEENLVSYKFLIRKPFYRTLWFLLISGIGLALFVYTVLRLRERRLERAAMLQRRQIESQLQTLKAQINPHFLFNSFNTLVSVIEDDPKSAVAYVENLSDFYRSILQYREKNLIPLHEELDIVRTFGYILKKRYGDALKIEIGHQWPADAWIVPLVLQILVENAVKHNIISEHKPLTIVIRSAGPDTLVVENNLQKRQVTDHSTHFGLQSIINRYALMTRRHVAVTQTTSDFSVVIPLLHHAEISDH